MKKWFIVMLAAMLVCISTGAMAMGWVTKQHHGESSP